MAFLAAAAPALWGATTASTATGMAAGSVAGLSAATATSAGVLSGLMPSLSTLATVAGLGGTALQAIGQKRAGEAAEAVSRLNATQAEQEAVVKTEAAKAETWRLSRQANAMEGEQAAAFGGSGFTLQGSPLEVMANTAREYERDILATGFGGQVGANQKLNEADIYRWQGRQQKQASLWGAGTTLLTGFGKLGLSRMGGRRYY